MQVLVIEDEPASLKLANLILASDGHCVTLAHSARNAIQAISENPPAIILLDLALPDLDGLELACRLKKDPTTRHIPIVAVTAYPGKFSREEALKAGCDAYIVKPIDTRSLAGQISAIAAQKGRDSPKPRESDDPKP